MRESASYPTGDIVCQECEREYSSIDEYLAHYDVGECGRAEERP